jgi:uncharacterized protein (TIGR00369 family)
VDVRSLGEGPYWKHLGMSVSVGEDGSAAVALDVSERHFQIMGRVHGGVIASLVDSAVAVAVHADMPEGSAAATVDLSVLYLRPVDRPQPLRAVGRVLARGRTVATGEAVVTDASGQTVARGTAVYRLYAAPPAGSE